MLAICKMYTCPYLENDQKKKKKKKTQSTIPHSLLLLHIKYFLSVGLKKLVRKFVFLSGNSWSKNVKIQVFPNGF